MSIHVRLPIPSAELDSFEQAMLDNRLSPTNYAQYAVNLLYGASELGFNPEATKLLSTDGPPLALPPLSDSSTGLKSDSMLRICLSWKAAEKVTEKAAQRNITQEEQLRRSLRFGAFITNNNTDHFPLFEHRGEKHIIAEM